MSMKIYYEGEENAFQEYLVSLKYDQLILIADANTNGFCIPVLKKICPLLKSSSIIVIPQGEANKSLDVCHFIWNRLFELNATKKSIVINIGGGVVSDIGGFVSSTYMRGIRFINIPTTLLSMVDACYGGKTGVDFNGTKNLIGTFSQPNSILIHPLFLNTLNERNIKNGIAETIKHALLNSSTWWDEIQDYELDNFINIQSIKKSLETKMKFVDTDLHDQGIRQALNFGHTIGHAIESYSLNLSKPLLHGEAIILGMFIELKISQAQFGFPSQPIHQFISLQQKFFPELTQTFTFDEIKPFLSHDKKNNQGIRMSLLKEIAIPITQELINETQITAALAS